MRFCIVVGYGREIRTPGHVAHEVSYACEIVVPKDTPDTWAYMETKRAEFVAHCVELNMGELPTDVRTIA